MSRSRSMAKQQLYWTGAGWEGVECHRDPLWPLYPLGYWICSYCCKFTCQYLMINSMQKGPCYFKSPWTLWFHSKTKRPVHLSPAHIYTNPNVIYLQHYKDYATHIFSRICTMPVCVCVAVTSKEAALFEINRNTVVLNMWYQSYTMKWNAELVYATCPIKSTGLIAP